MEKLVFLQRKSMAIQAVIPKKGTHQMPLKAKNVTTLAIDKAHGAFGRAAGTFSVIQADNAHDARLIIKIDP